MTYLDIDEKTINEKDLYFMLDKQKIKDETVEGKKLKVKIICKIVICSHLNGLHMKFLHYKAPICGNDNLVEIYKTIICQDMTNPDNLNNWSGYFKNEALHGLYTTESIDEFEEKTHFDNVNINQIVKMLDKTEEKFKSLAYYQECFHPEDYGFDIAREKINKFLTQTGGKKAKSKSKSKSKSKAIPPSKAKSTKKKPTKKSSSKKSSKWGSSKMTKLKKM